MCSLTQVVYYERNIGPIHTREEKPNLVHINRKDQGFDGKLVQMYLSKYPSELTKLDKKLVKIGHKFT